MKQVLNTDVTRCYNVKTTAPYTRITVCLNALIVKSMHFQFFLLVYNLQA